MPLTVATPRVPLAVGIDAAVVQQSPPLAVNVTGVLAIPVPVAAAVSVFVLPHVEPRVQLPAVAIPLAPVLVVVLVTLPLFSAGTNVTVTLGRLTGLPYWSVA